MTNSGERTSAESAEGAREFRKRPVVVRALRWTGHNFDAVTSFMGVAQFENGYVLINTLEGEMRTAVGDWIIRGVQGEFYPCKPDIFAATYEPASEVSADLGRSLPESANQKDGRRG